MNIERAVITEFDRKIEVSNHYEKIYIVVEDTIEKKDISTLLDVNEAYELMCNLKEVLEHVRKGSE